jgi:hypothetical protein
MKKKKEEKLLFEVTPDSDGVIRGDVFIIPQSLLFLENCTGGLEHFEQLKRIYHRHLSLKDVLSDEFYVRIQCSSGRTGNWQVFEMPDRECFPDYLPVSIFDNKKEGDVISFNSKWGKIELTLSQKIRGKNEGTFETVLARLIKEAKKYKEKRVEN